MVFLIQIPRNVEEVPIRAYQHFIPFICVPLTHPVAFPRQVRVAPHILLRVNKSILGRADGTICGSSVALSCLSNGKSMSNIMSTTCI
jgi:hypothetical protein